MASKTTLTAKNLENLGAAVLADLLMEISEGNANAKRRLRLELAGSESTVKLVNEIRKRLTSIGAATNNIGSRTLKGFRGDLNTQRRLIVEQVAKSEPGEALDLMWQLLEIGDAVIERTSDLTGDVVEIFKTACGDIPDLMLRSGADVTAQVKHIVRANLANSYGQNDTLISRLAPHLQADSLRLIQSELLIGAKTPASPSAIRPRTTKRWRKRALAASDILRKRSKTESLRHALLAIADALGDVDAFIALMGENQSVTAATQIALRLLNAGRAAEALKALDSVRRTSGVDVPSAWTETRIAVLDALGLRIEAQSVQLDHFHKTLQPDVLRSFLKRLPDFDDIEAEDDALDRVRSYPNANAALSFLVQWPALDRAADMVVSRIRELDGHDAKALTYAADRLSSRYPLAAMLIHRQIVEADLMSLSESAHAAAELPYLEAESLSKHIDNFSSYGSHEVWHKSLTDRFARRSVFWRSLS